MDALPFFPYVRIVRKCLKLREFIAEPVTLGEHLKRRRLSLGLTQKEACSLLDKIAVETLINWEKDRTEPPIPSMPAILRFLGYDPLPEPRTLGERMLAKRRAMGWTVKKAAQTLGVDPSSWSEWERRGEIPWERYRALAEAFLRDCIVDDVKQGSSSLRFIGDGSTAQ